MAPQYGGSGPCRPSVPAKGVLTLIRPAYVASLYGRSRYGSIAGALAAVVIAATAFAPISAGAAHDLLGSYDPLLWPFVVLLVREDPARIETALRGRN